MFGDRYYGPRYFANRYFGPTASGGGGGGGSPSAGEDEIVNITDIVTIATIILSLGVLYVLS